MENNYENRIGFSPRLGALLVDVVVIIVVALVIVGPILGVFMGAEAAEAAKETATASGGDQMDKDLAEAGGGIGGFFAGMVLSLPITGFLYTLIEGLTGASPAKMMFGIKIANEDGTKANRNTLIKRWAFRNGSSLIQILAAIGLTFLSPVSGIYGLIITVGCFMVLRDNKQSFHGAWSKTAVFKKSDIN